MIHGTVAWFDAERGVGAIRIEDGREVAVRSSGIDGGGRQSLRPADRVACTVHRGPDGPRAVRVWIP